MRPFEFARPGSKLSVLCLGAHPDDIEIGAGGTILEWLASGAELSVHWCVLSAAGGRAEEARTAAAAFLTGASATRIEIAEFRDAFFPSQSNLIKEWMADLRARSAPDVIFTHRQNDDHQDHREVSQATWSTFRDHLILEYEVPKWDGDMPQPNVYCALRKATLDRKIGLLLSCFGSQRSKDWFDAEVFCGLARLRGMECRSPERYAEAFVLRKALLS